MEQTTKAAAKVAEEMLKDVEESAQRAEQLAKTQQTPDVQFQAVLEQQQLTVSPASASQLSAQQSSGLQTSAPQPTDMASLLRAAREAQEVPRVPAIGQAADSHPAVTSLHRIMDDIMQGQNKLEHIIELSMSGRNFSSQELLGLQAGVYRFTQELELTSKVVEKGTSAIKQTMNTQV